MPNLAALVREGASGVLNSSVPPVTAPAWTTFHTGANPGKHGVYDFVTFNRHTRQFGLANTAAIKLPLLWEVASQAGQRVACINVPLTYPPRAVNGVMVGGMLAPRVDSSLLHPPDEFDAVFGAHPGYAIAPPILSERHAMGDTAFVQANITVERARTKLALDLLRREPWDLFMVQNQCLDIIQHAYMPHLDPASPLREEAIFETVLPFYKAMDENIGQLANAVPEMGVLAISDHGFQWEKRMISLAPWLKQQGWLVEDITPRQRLMQLARRMDVFNLRRRLAHRVIGDRRNMFEGMGQAAGARINWARTQAFVAVGSIFGCVYVNRRAVPDPQSLLEELRAQLAALRDPQTGQQVVRQTWLGTELYHGEESVHAPDLILEPVDHYTFSAPAIVPHHTPFYDIDPKLGIPGGHHPEGVLVWRGPGIVPRTNVDAHLMDLAPTLLARAGVPVPDHMDGRVAQLWEAHLEAERQPWAGAVAGAAADYAADEEQSLRERLSDLGYL